MFRLRRASLGRSGARVWFYWKPKVSASAVPGVMGAAAHPRFTLIRSHRSAIGVCLASVARDAGGPGQGGESSIESIHRSASLLAQSVVLQVAHSR